MGNCCPGGTEPSPESIRTEKKDQSSLSSAHPAGIDGSPGPRRRGGKSSLNEALRKGSLLSLEEKFEYYSSKEESIKDSKGELKDVSRDSKEVVAESPEQLSKRYSQRDIKILLLGTGESGKSTILKQMKILHKGGFSLEERTVYRNDIYRNIVEGMQQIICAISDFKIDFGCEETKTKTEMYSLYLESLEVPEYEEWDGIPFSILEAVSYMWNMSGIQKIYEVVAKGSYIIDSAPYFLDELDRVGAAGYIPTDADILRARSTTNGISEVCFRSRFFNIRMIDVGGQRSERDKKWVQCFENVTCVIFCVSLSEYDQVLLEETGTNRMLESFQLFEDVVNSQWFLNSSIVLFLNKTDLFCRKLTTVPLRDYFDDYHGAGNSFEQAAEFLRDKFLSLNQYRLQIYPYLTCATDTENIHMVFQAVEETVLANALRDTGIF